jgi:hypothetical protein
MHASIHMVLEPCLAWAVMICTYEWLVDDSWTVLLV